MNTVLITGCSTGFGREIALHFLAQGWNVVATMRDPAASTLPASERLRVLPLDVTDPGSIRSALAKAGPIDVLVNNAGIGWLNAVEGTSAELAHGLFETNFFGTLAMLQAVLPDMRQRGAGVIINIGSSSTLKPLPLLAVYRASKAAVTALTESLDLELSSFGIRARVVVPGMAPTTSFAENVQQRLGTTGGFSEPYAPMAEAMLEGLRTFAPQEVTSTSDVAEAVYRAATDPDCPVVLPAGPDAIACARAAE
ncbi:SDR family oxidoreductase [Paracoccus aestuariivivens]|uniref:SDR family NAD(P)-dependent oxidoreductase n=1 Tax=Paracoccus aestuariivivens TaxID=1820333 RepID=A0A6L6JG50_9RHOB|nr:SDR family oxidoreductase [Paracoccus aestuariivivens]MTH80168.1 SDR family NAD(P)-dependent oxidoreductase [Paracoccus aestuariivivens]